MKQPKDEGKAKRCECHCHNPGYVIYNCTCKCPDDNGFELESTPPVNQSEEIKPECKHEKFIGGVCVKCDYVAFSELNKPLKHEASQTTSDPRRYGKSSLVTNEFLARCKAEKSVVYEHPDFTAYSKKALDALLSQTRAETAREIKRKWVTPSGNLMEHINLMGKLLDELEELE